MRLVRVISMLFLAAALSPSALRGQGTLYWDTNGPVAGSGNAGGNWWGNDWSTSSQGTLATQSWTNVPARSSRLAATESAPGAST